MHHSRTALQKLALLLLPFAVNGCAYLGFTGSGVERSDLARVPLELDVFSARGFLGGSDYERYYLSKGLLWRECGNISPGSSRNRSQALEGDEVFASDPALSIKQRRVESLTPDQQEQLKQLSQVLISAIESSEVQEPPPGPVFSLSEPGVFELSIKLGAKKSRVITSVDAVADKTSRSLKEAHELFSLVRGLGPTICNSPTFFGIARKEI